MPNDHLAHQETEDTIGTDRASRADLERAPGGRHAGGGRIAIALLASFAIIVLLIYGLNNQRDETAAPRNAPQGETTGSGGTAKPGAPQHGRSDSPQRPPAAAR